MAVGVDCVSAAMILEALVTCDVDCTAGSSEVNETKWTDSTANCSCADTAKCGETTIADDAIDTSVANSTGVALDDE